MSSKIKVKDISETSIRSLTDCEQKTRQQVQFSEALPRNVGQAKKQTSRKLIKRIKQESLAESDKDKFMFPEAPPQESLKK